jgi:hypothetical protein
MDAGRNRKGQNMTRKKGKPISFDAMVKFFLQNYKIPTKKDIDRLEKRISQLEKLIRATAGTGRTRLPAASKRRTGNNTTAMDTVYNVIKRSPNGASCKYIQSRTGFDDKKIRNLIFRLNKRERIKRQRRGIYTAK